MPLDYFNISPKEVGQFDCRKGSQSSHNRKERIIARIYAKGPKYDAHRDLLAEAWLVSFRVQWAEWSQAR